MNNYENLILGLKLKGQKKYIAHIDYYENGPEIALSENRELAFEYSALCTATHARTNLLRNNIETEVIVLREVENDNR